jgi:hypothetical protein
LPDSHVPKRFIVKATNVFCYEKNWFTTNPAQYQNRRFMRI